MVYGRCEIWISKYLMCVAVQECFGLIRIMKKLFLSICLLLCVNVLLAQQVNFTYTVRENRAIVTGLANNDVTELVIPDVIPGTTTPITEINQTAFMNKSSLVM